MKIGEKNRQLSVKNLAQIVEASDSPFNRGIARSTQRECLMATFVQNGGAEWSARVFPLLMKETEDIMDRCVTFIDHVVYAKFLVCIVHQSVEDPLNVWITCEQFHCTPDHSFKCPELFVTTFIEGGGVEWARTTLMPFRLRRKVL